MAGTVSEPDVIRLEGMVFFGRHGTRREERSLGQQFEVDVSIEADLSEARASDKLADTIDYGEVYAIAESVIVGPSRNLLERLADEIAGKVLGISLVQAVRVRVTKPRLPLRGGILNAASVEVSKRRE